MKSSSRTNQIIAFAITLLFHGLVILALCMVYLRYSPSSEADRQWPPVDSAEVLFGGEYVMVGDTPEPTAPNSQEAAAQADPQPTPPSPQVESTVNSGKTAPDPTPVMTTSRPSPAKAETPVTKPKETGPTKAEIEAAERAKREEETRTQIASKVKFGSSGNASGTGSGKTGSPNGNSETGAVSGAPGYSMGGRSIASWKTPPRGPMGKVTVRVSVNREGDVTSASYVSGEGPAAASATTRQNCIAAAKQSKFSVDLNGPAIQTGTITYNFR